MGETALSQLPRHVAIIMDGNGRWAKQRLCRRIMGHEEGANSVREIVQCCRKLGIPHLTLYSFSKENWQRPDAEVSGLWRLLHKFLRSELHELVEKEIRLCHWGDLDGLPQEVLDDLEEATRVTAGFDKLVLSLALNYGGRQEIVRAARLAAQDILAGRHRLEDLDPEIFSSYLFSAGFPDPDLIIRTGGEHRLSNFLLWQLAYAEIYVTPILWPDFREPEFMLALEDYGRRERRFGKTSEQVVDDLATALNSNPR
jgi:undecaprenyl diphosphate synthase